MLYFAQKKVKFINKLINYDEKLMTRKKKLIIKIKKKRKLFVVFYINQKKTFRKKNYQNDDIKLRRSI